MSDWSGARPMEVDALMETREKARTRNGRGNGKKGRNGGKSGKGDGQQALSWLTSGRRFRGHADSECWIGHPGALRVWLSRAPCPIL